MKLKAFRVQYFRSIIDSGWIETDDITVVVGKNESGKTSLLKALSKFSTSSPEQFDIAKEWPRDPHYRKDRSPKTPVVTVQFDFTKSEIDAIANSDILLQEIEGVEISRNYMGEYQYKLLPETPQATHFAFYVAGVLDNQLSMISTGSNKILTQYRTHIEATKKLIQNETHYDSILSILEKLHTVINEQYLAKVQESDTGQEIRSLIEETALPILQVGNTYVDVSAIYSLIESWLPHFIYMDNYRIFSGSAQLNQVKARIDANEPLPEDLTFVTILELAGLNLDKEVARANELDKQQRIDDLHDASVALSARIANRWTQKSFSVQFRADGHHFVTQIIDEDSKIPVPLEDRSKGFQWFFSFDMNFMYETNGAFKNAILLLDEPGLHLHAAAQEDLLKRIKEYSKNNQFIYTTHLPFMIDTHRFDAIYVAEGSDNGVKFHKNWAIADADASFTLLAAIGLTWSQLLFFGRYNLVVEGVTDYWLIDSVSQIFESGGLPGYSRDLSITPAGGASRAVHLTSLLCGQKLNVVVLLDSDAEGQKAYDDLVKEWLIKERLVLMLGKIINLEHPFRIEDMFDPEYYLSFVNEVYKKELKGKPLVNDTSDKSILDKVDSELKARGFSRFNKGSIAKKILQDLKTKQLGDLSETTVENFKLLFSAINKIVAEWKKS